MASMLMRDDDDDDFGFNKYKEEPYPRSGHVFCQMKDSIFIWGGGSDFRLDMEQCLMWFYYPLAKKWIKIYSWFLYPKISSGSGAIYVSSKQSVYLFFGYSNGMPKNCIYSFDTVQYKWSCINEGTTKNKHNPSPRDQFALWEFQNKIYIFGGHGFPLFEYLHDDAEFDEDLVTYPGGMGWNNQLLEFDVETEKWREVPHSGSVPCPRDAHGATRVKDKVYVFGGRHEGNKSLNDLHQLDLLHMAWTRIVSDITPSKRSWHTFGHLSDNRHLVVVGGSYSHKTDILDDIWLYDIETNTWTEYSRPSSHTKRIMHTMCVTEDDDVVIFGGRKTNICSIGKKVHINNLTILRFSPDTLFRLAVQIIIKNRNIFADQLSNIPEFFKNLVMKTWQISDSPHLQVEL